MIENPSQHAAQEVADDPALLELFLSDMEQQSNIWQPTSYWTWQCRRMQVQLQNSGLHGFRTNWDLMRGVDLGPKQGGLSKRIIATGGLARVLTKIGSLTRDYEAYIEELIRISNAELNAGISRQVSLLYQLLLEGKQSRQICEIVSDSMIGQPNVYTLDGKSYSSNILHHICLVGLLHQLAGKSSFNRIVEIGGGYGALPEVLLKCQRKPGGYFVSIDIPPLVYVATQYLKAVFPGRVLDYREVRGTSKISAVDIEGRILIIPPWSVPKLDMDFDLLWNSASFQEMEIDVIENYLDFLATRSSSIFINTLTEGHRKGLSGQKDQISFATIMKLLESRGFHKIPPDPCSIEYRAFHSALPRHTAALFARLPQGNS